MTSRRGDKVDKTHFRTDRFIEQDGKWYFQTREGAIEGPFGDLAQAKRRLETYIQVSNSGVLGPGADLDQDLELTPLD